MSWVILVLSGILEAVWATALGKSEGFTKLWPTVVFGVTLVASMGGLAVMLTVLTLTGVVQVWQVYLIALGLGLLGVVLPGSALASNGLTDAPVDPDHVILYEVTAVD